MLTVDGYRPPKIVFLSDCYLENVCWGTFYLSIIRTLAAASDSLLAVRTNSFFHGASTEFISSEHMSAVVRSISKFKPDVVFSINHSGLTKETLKVIPATAKIITLFIDSPDRCPEELRSFNKRDFIWGTGMGAIRDNFISTYKNVLSEDQIEFTLWGADTAVFKPQGFERDIDVAFVGSAYTIRPFSELLNAVSIDPKNRQILVELYLEHRKTYVFDLVKELGLRKFNFGNLDNKTLRTLTTNSSLQTIFADQISSEQRISCLSALRDMNIEIYGEPQAAWVDLISGYDGSLLSRFKYKAVHDDAELARIYNTSKIGLNVQIDHAREWGLSFRVFDIMACGALLMTPSLSKNPLSSMGFKDGEDYISFDTPEDLRRKCKYYVEHEQERERITKSALVKLRKAHTFRHRLTTVFAKAGLPELAQQFCDLADEDINEQLYDTKIWFLDLFGKDRKIGRDFDPRTRYEIDHNIPAGQLDVQLNSFRMSLVTDSIPMPRVLKYMVRQFIKYSVSALVWLAQKGKWKIALTKLSKQESITNQESV